MPMLSICAYCKTEYGQRPGDGLSHGYCDDCCDALHRQFDAGLSTELHAVLAARGITDVSYRVIGSDVGPACQRGVK